MLTGRHKAKNRSSEIGFTLIELLFVILLMTVLSGLSYPLYGRAYRKIAHEEAALRLTKLMTYARGQAVMQGKRFRIYVDPEINQAWLAAENIKNFCEPFKRLDNQWGKSFDIPRDIQIKTTTPHITFFPDGTAGQAVITLVSKEKDQWSVRMDEVTGTARVTHEE